MTFDEWWHSKGWNFGSEKAKAAWEAATLAERERCAKLCEDMVLYTGSEDNGKPGPTCPIWHGESKSEDPDIPHRAEDWECAMKYLDDLGAPTEDEGGCVFSIIGRIARIPPKNKSDIAALIEEIADNKETVIAAGPEPQFDADEPRYSVHITGPKRLLEKFSSLIFELPGQENKP